ncbi:MAG: hypothetical protein D6703_07095, partial [Zetaproteobacteria bacterium]
ELHSDAALLRRRGIRHGWVRARDSVSSTDDEGVMLLHWHQAKPIHLPSQLLPSVPDHAEHIRDALGIMQRVRGGESCLDILDEPRYQQRLQPDFEMLAAVHSGHDPQEIEKITFDAVKSGELFAEDLWMKVSRLSFYEEDASIRFRFSYGLEMFKAQEDDPLRERLAAELAQRVFPECAMVTENAELNALLRCMLGMQPLFVERIIYSNAPNGGAQFHQDVEQGHLGVVYAQLHGRTGWLALPRNELIDEIRTFLAEGSSLLSADFDEDQLESLQYLARDEQRLVEALESEDQGVLEQLLNHSPLFTRRLVEHGWGILLQAGDVLLLPQQATDLCCWHAVFCLDEEPGHALSFALATGA